MLKYFSLCLIFFVGCTQIKPEFYDVVVSHRDLVNETNRSIILSIADELNRTDITESQRKDLNVLKDRLDFSMKQADILVEYLNKKVIDEQFVQELVQHRWKNQ